MAHYDGSDDLDRTAQQYSNIHIDGDAKVHLGNTYYQTGDGNAILNRLSGSTPTARLEQILEERLDGSADWFLDSKQYLDWRDGDVDTLWCHGVPGAGKTFVMASVVEDLQSHQSNQHETATVYYFCDFQNREKQSISQVLASITRQLVEHRPALTAIAQQHPALRSPRTTERLGDLVSQLCTDFSEVHVLLDALDEFSPHLEQRTALASTLTKLQDRASGKTSLKLCISSRGDEEARKALPRHIAVPVRPDSESIRTYIIACMQMNSTLQRIDRSNALYLEIIDEVGKQSDRIFKLADLQMRYLASLTSTFKIKQALPMLSTRFEDYYKLSLDRIRDKPSLQGRIFNFCAWLLHAKAPLHLNELRQCLCIDEDTTSDTALEDLDEHVERLASESEGLIVAAPVKRPSVIIIYSDLPGRELDPRGLSFRFAHETIATFLATHIDLWTFRGHDPDLFIYARCAQFMSLADCASILFRTRSTSAHDIEWEKRVGGNFVPWCLKNWERHYPANLPKNIREARALILLRRVVQQFVQVEAQELMPTSLLEPFCVNTLQMMLTAGHGPFCTGCHGEFWNWPCMVATSSASMTEKAQKLLRRILEFIKEREHDIIRREKRPRRPRQDRFAELRSPCRWQ